MSVLLVRDFSARKSFKLVSAHVLRERAVQAEDRSLLSILQIVHRCNPHIGDGLYLINSPRFLVELQDGLGSGIVDVESGGGLLNDETLVFD